VMPGAGVHASNIASLAHATGAMEFHASAKAGLPSGMQWTNPTLTDMATGEIRTDQANVQALVAALQSLA
jgi:copper homeostasis protein